MWWHFHYWGPKLPTSFPASAPVPLSSTNAATVKDCTKGNGAKSLGDRCNQPSCNAGIRPRTCLGASRTRYLLVQLRNQGLCGADEGVVLVFGLQEEFQLHAIPVVDEKVPGRSGETQEQVDLIVFLFQGMDLPPAEKECWVEGSKREK